MLLVALCLVIGLSGAALAVDYYIRVLEVEDDPNTGIPDVTVYFIYNGNVEFMTTTDGNGEALYVRPDVFPGPWKAKYNQTWCDPYWGVQELPANVFEWEFAPVDDMRP